MLPMPPEEEALVDEYTTKLARLMHKYTEPEKLKDFESIEVELRDQIVELVAPKIGNFFFRRGRKTLREQAKNKKYGGRDRNQPKTS